MFGLMIHKIVQNLRPTKCSWPGERPKLDCVLCCCSSTYSCSYSCCYCTRMCVCVDYKAKLMHLPHMVFILAHKTN